MELETFAHDFARGIEAADARRPVSKNWQAGIGPHDEVDVITLVMNELAAVEPGYAAHQREVPYGTPGTRQRCDTCFGEAAPFDWAIEVKALRMLGDRGIVVQGRDDVSRILSPYPAQRSARTDCTKLATASLAARRAILIYAFDADEYPMRPLISDFESLAAKRVRLGAQVCAPFSQLIHPVHREGAVFAWELLGRLP